jgi:formylmethanofuran dehydrogenase subunit E
MPVYRTAQGRMVDMGKLAVKNEKTRAVGNMNVNARGDILDSHNQVIQDNTRRVKKSYQKSVSEKPTQKVVSKPSISDAEQLSAAERVLFDDDEDFKK